MPMCLSRLFRIPVVQLDISDVAFVKYGLGNTRHFNSPFHSLFVFLVVVEQFLQHLWLETGNTCQCHTLAGLLNVATFQRRHGLLLNCGNWWVSRRVFISLACVCTCVYVCCEKCVRHECTFRTVTVLQALIWVVVIATQENSSNSTEEF